MILSRDVFDERRRGLENECVYRVDQELLRQLREQAELQDNPKRLAEAIGVADRSVIVELIEQGFRVETLLALSLIPVLQVAWADGRLDREEREAILSAARSAGVIEGTASYELLLHWLQQDLNLALFVAWKHYATALAGTVSREQLSNLRHNILGRAQRVTRAAGGCVGLGKVSRFEAAVLTEIANTLNVALWGD